MENIAIMKGCPEIPRLVSLVSARGFLHKKGTVAVDRALIHHLQARFGSEITASDLDERLCREFAHYLLNRVRLNSAWTYLHKLRAVMDYAVRQKLIPSNPMPHVSELLPRAFRCPRVHLTTNELNRLGKAPCPHESTKRAFLFACQTGLRLSDVETLRWSDVVMEDGVLIVTKVQVKTGREVRVPLNPIALSLMGQRSPDDGLVFKLMSRSVIATDLAGWSRAAGIDKHLTFHVSRHTFATLSIAAGVDIYAVSKLCGHTSVKTTEIYAHMVDDRLVDAVFRLGSSVSPECKMKKNTKMTRLKSCVNHLKKIFSSLQLPFL